MGFLDHITFPDTKGGATVRKFIEAQDQADFSDAANIFAPDIVFEGQMFEANGREAVTKIFQDFCSGIIVKINMEAVAKCGDCDKYMVLYTVLLKGAEENLLITDLVTTDEKGLICRLDNCFDPRKVKLPAPP